MNEVAGYYSMLSKGFREIGIECDFITYGTHPFNYHGESPRPIVLRFRQLLVNLRNKPRRPRILKVLIKISVWLPSKVLLYFWVFRAAFKYDVFIFGYGSSLLPRKNWDLLFLKLLNKLVIANLGHGSETRPPYIDGSYQSKDGKIQPSASRLLSLAKSHLKKAKFFEQHASVILGAPFSTSQFTTKRFINCFTIGMPFIWAEEPEVQDSENSAMKDSAVVRMLHSPSHPALKGSARIKAVIDKLKAKGHLINFVVMREKTNDEVIREIRQCDFIIDQLYSDTPMSTFPAEAAWFGKPSVVCGYDLDSLRDFVPHEMWPPSKICHPDELEQAVEGLIVNSEERNLLGQMAQRFVREKWNAVEVARRYLTLINDEAPDEWWVEPNSVSYLAGVGQSEEKTKTTIRELVGKYGASSLQLSHRPDLEKAFLEFAEIEEHS